MRNTLPINAAVSLSRLVCRIEARDQGNGQGAGGSRGLEAIRFIPRGIFHKGERDRLPMNAFPEPMVARVTGVHRETLAQARRLSLAKGNDWTLENSVVCYTPAGLKKLISAVGLGGETFVWETAPTGTGDPVATPPRASPDSKKIPAAGTVAAGVAAAGVAVAAREVVALKITSVSRNPSIVHATDGKTAVLVRVRTNENFTAGMPIKARAPAAGSTLYHFEGNCPRWKGRY